MASPVTAHWYAVADAYTRRDGCQPSLPARRDGALHISGRNTVLNCVAMERYSAATVCSRIRDWLRGCCQIPEISLFAELVQGLAPTSTRNSVLLLPARQAPSSLQGISSPPLQGVPDTDTRLKAESKGCPRKESPHESPFKKGSTGYRPCRQQWSLGKTVGGRMPATCRCSFNTRDIDAQLCRRAIRH